MALTRPPVKGSGVWRVMQEQCETHRGSNSSSSITMVMEIRGSSHTTADE